MNKFKQKLQKWLMLVAVLSSFAIQPISAVAQTIDSVQIGQAQSESETDFSEETSDSSNEQSSNTESETTQKKEDETSIGESQNANDSPKESSQGNFSADFLAQNQLIQGEDGKLYTTTASNYTDTPLSELSNLMSRALAGSGIVYVDPNAHVSNIDIWLSNGNREYGWYGSARRSCPR